MALSRRAFLTVAGVAGAAALMGLHPTEARAVAEGGLVDYVQGRTVTYGNYFTNEFKADGVTGYCCIPKLSSASSGRFPIRHYMLYNAPQPDVDVAGRIAAIRAVLYYSPGGPGFNDGAMYKRRLSTWYDGTPLTYDRYIVLAHILLSDIYNRNGAAAILGVGNQALETYLCQRVLSITPDGEWDPTYHETALRYMWGGGDCVAPESFETFIVDCGSSFQPIMSSVPSGKGKLTKSASRKAWL